MHAWSPYMKQKDIKQVKNQHCIKDLSKLTDWSTDEMHAWSQYMKQKDRKQVIKSTCVKICSKLTDWSIDEVHAWPPYTKQNESQINTASKFRANLLAGV